MQVCMWQRSLLTTSLLALVACGNFRAGHTEQTKLPYRAHVDPVTRSQYTILEPVVTDACATQIALWPLPIQFAFHKKDAQQRISDPASDSRSSGNGDPSADGSPIAGGPEGRLGRQGKRGYRVEFWRSARRKALEAASQKGLLQLEGKADIVYSPSFISEEKYIRWWRRDVCVKLSMTGVHLKREAELTPAQAEERPRTTSTVINGAGGSLRDAIEQ